MEKLLRSDRRKRKSSLDSRQMKELESSFRKGETLRAAAEKAGCSPGTVYAWYQRFKAAQTTK